MVKLISIALALFLSHPAWSLTTVPCRKNILPGYKFINRERSGDRYQDAAKRVTLYVKCYPLTTSSDDLISALKPQANPKNMDGEAVYFEISTYTKAQRVYVVTRKPVMQLTFETRWRNRVWLEPTQAQMEKAFARQKTPTFRTQK